MSIEKASERDLGNIFALTKSCAKLLISQGIFQWNEHYPSKEVLLNDIKLKQIWKCVINNKLVGIIVLTEVEDEDYKRVKWLTNNQNNLYVHRLAIHPDYQGEGYARKLMGFAEQYAVDKKYNSIRLDTFSQNKRNQRFYEKRNYVKLSEIFLPNQSEFPFYCYEKVLNV